MATFTTPLPAPIKNDWLPTGDNPRLSPPSPGGPRKNAPVQQVRYTKFYCSFLFGYQRYVHRDPLEALEAAAHHHHRQVEDLPLLFQTDQEVKA